MERVNNFIEAHEITNEWQILAITRLIRVCECSRNDLAKFANVTHVNATHTCIKRKSPATSSQNPSAVGQSVTFTAGVSAVAPGAAIPTGTVTFLDGAGSIGTGTLGPLSGGLATLTTSALTAGTHNITAQYGGDSSFNSTALILPRLGGRLLFTANVTFVQTFTGARYLVSATVTLGAGTCSGTTSVSCTLPAMAINELRLVRIVVTPSFGRNVVGTAKVTSDVVDPITSNNTATSTARIRFKPQRF